MTEATTTPFLCLVRRTTSEAHVRFLQRGKEEIESICLLEAGEKQRQLPESTLNGVGPHSTVKKRKSFQEEKF